MGAAEDAYRRRQKAFESDMLRKKQDAEEAIVRDMQMYLPRAVANLRRLGYPIGITLTRMIVWNREERVAWVLRSMSNGEECANYSGALLLSDGTVIVEEMNGELRLARDWCDIVEAEIASRMKYVASFKTSWWSRMRFAFIRPQLRL